MSRNSRSRRSPMRSAPNSTPMAALSRSANTGVCVAYRIKKNRKGHYMLLGLDAKPAFVTEMERKLGLNEDILRFMTVRIDEIDEAPSAILSRKSDDRERGFRGPKPAGRFESGRRRGFDDREEFRARDG